MSCLLGSVDFEETKAKVCQTRFSQPIPVGGFSIDGKGEFHAGGSPRTLAPQLPALGTDLNSGINDFICKDESNLGSLEFVRTAAAAADFDLTQNHIRFVSFRNNLNKIMATPYSQDAWEIGVTIHAGIISLHVREMEESTYRHMSLHDKKRFNYYGFHFESLCVLHSEKDHGVNANEEFCNLFRVGVGSHRLLVAAEIDCCTQNEQNNSVENVEIKTSRILEHPGQWRTWESSKLLKFWIQSFVVGTPTIIVGFRDDGGLLKKIEVLKTVDLPRLARRNKPYWDWRVCVQFLDQVLSLVSKFVVNEDELYVLQFVPPFQQVNLFQGQPPRLVQHEQTDRRNTRQRV